MDGISPAQLATQVATARRLWGAVIDPAERRHNLPAGLLYAVGSRETNLNPRYTQGSTGDRGHGHGLFQLDNRSHHIPAGFDRDVARQAETAAGMLAGLLIGAGSWHFALNRYNSGRSSDAATTGHNYGPDVLDRLAHITGGHPAAALHPVLQRGARGPVVTQWQKIIGAVVDGNFGPATEAVTRAWQTRHHLTADGVVGPRSWAAAGL